MPIAWISTGPVSSVPDLEVMFFSTGQVHANRLQLADSAASDQFTGKPGIGPRSLMTARLENPAVSSYSFANRSPFGHSVGQRFFAENILAGIEGSDAGQGMPVIRRGHNHGGNIGARHQLPEISVSFAVLIPVLAVNKSLALLPVLRIHIANGNNLSVGKLEEHLDEILPAATRADDADCDTIAWRSPNQPARRVGRKKK